MKNIVQILEEYIQAPVGQYCHHGLLLCDIDVYLLQFHKEKVKLL